METQEMNGSKFELIWEQCLSIIKDNVPPQSFKTWFEPIKPVSVENNVLTILVPSQFFYEWIEEHYVDILRKTIKRILGSDGKLEYKIVMDNSGGQPHTIKMPGNAGRNKNPEIQMPVNIGIRNPFIIPGLKKMNIQSNLNTQYTFEKFVEGENNKLARSAGLAVAKSPGGTSFNPLFIYGSVGLGKTHLINAIGNEVKVNFPNKTVLYVQMEKFINQFFESIKNNELNDFVNFYQLIDVLIVDDVYLLSGKEKTQEIFFNIFNHLHINDKQIILTSDRPPKDLKGFQDRLLSRFKWGLSADLQSPDFETRVAILETKLYSDGIEMSREVVEFIAHNITSNIRELEGTLISILANASVNNVEPNLEIARTVVKNLVKNIPMELSIESINNTVCDYFNLTIDKIKSKSRKREIVQARQIAMFFSKQLTKSSLKTIGEFYGGRDHSTVIHSCQTVEDLVDTDKTFKTFVEDISKKIKLGTL